MRLKKALGALVLLLLIAVLAVIVVKRQSEGNLETEVSSAPISEETPELSPSPSPTPSPTPAPTPTPYDPYADRPDIDISSWEYTLVNNDHTLGSDFVPQLTAVANGQYFDSRAADYLNEMISDAQAEGLTVYITSSYRSYDTQEYLFNRKVNQYISSEGSQEAAVEKARTIVAYPGTSEHQLGLACDIVDKYYEYMNESIADTQLAKWLYAHCAEYGFILRYPKDKTDITGVMYEPWHFRYVGTEAAEYIMSKGLTLEEFLALYQ